MLFETLAWADLQVQPNTALAMHLARMLRPAGLVTVTDIGCRPPQQRDLPFLHGLYASIHDPGHTGVDWPEVQKMQSLHRQCHVQYPDDQRNFPFASFEIITWMDENVGCLYIGWGARELQIRDLALLPEYRGRGIGSAILDDLLFQATVQNKAVSVCIEHDNPAQSLCRKFGFTDRGGNEACRQMVWHPVTNARTFKYGPAISDNECRPVP